MVILFNDSSARQYLAIGMIAVQQFSETRQRDLARAAISPPPLAQEIGFEPRQFRFRQQRMDRHIGHQFYRSARRIP